jgi:short-subunit dehydrogenase
LVFQSADVRARRSLNTSPSPSLNVGCQFKQNTILKKVFISGITRGLGKELFEQFSERKYFVYGLLRDEKKFKELSEKSKNNTKLILADISSDDCISQIQQIVKADKIDLIINNAGIGGEESKLENIKTFEIIKLFNVHCLGVIRVLQALRENFSENDNSTILNINSRLGSISRQSLGIYKNLEVSYSYRIAKASQNMLTNCLKFEFKNQTFVSLTPGKLKTDISQPDADTLPSQSAKNIIDFWEQNRFQNENGIKELNGNLIEW